MVAVWVLVANASDLAQLNVLAAPCVRTFLIRGHVRVVPRLPWCLLIGLSEVLACKEEHLLVESANDRYFWLLLLLLTLSIRLIAAALLARRC